MKRKKNQKVWEALKTKHSNYLVEAGWFANSKYDNGTPIGGIAAVQNYGAVINHPGGTPYFVDKNGEVHFVSTEVTKKGVRLKKTKPHVIVIPPTHFYENCKDSNKEKWARLFQVAWANVFAGKMSADTAMEGVAAEIDRDLVHSITNGNFPPDKPSTVKRKLSTYSDKKDEGLLANRLRGTTGLMVDTISHKVTKK